jgi:hypothetical protein
MNTIVKEDDGDLRILSIKIGKKEHAVLRDAQGRVVARFTIKDSCPLMSVPVIIEAPPELSILRIPN